MGNELRELRRRQSSVQSTKKITKAMEMIAASRIQKARQRVEAAQPYAEAMIRMVTAMASQGNIEHPLVEEKETRVRAAVLVISSDRGLAGGYNAHVFRTAGELQQLLRDEGKDPLLYVVGRKGVSYYRFRNREVEQSWTGFSEKPAYSDAKEVADVLIDAFLADTEDDGGVDEIHIVSTKFESMLTQRPAARRALPLAVEYTDEEPEGGPLPLYEFEPDPESLLDALLPRYVTTRVFDAMLEAAASEQASRQRAMKAASDNAEELIEDLGQQANQARQAEITQEISEISAGAEALSG